MEIFLTTIASYLDNILDSARFPGEQNGIYLPSRGSIKRIGLALEPWEDMSTWVQQEQLDALFLHRPWRLAVQSLPASVGVLAYHLAFDLTLTIGYNLRLASVLQLRQPEPFAYKDSVPYGMIGEILPAELHTINKRLTDVFGVAPTLHGRQNKAIQRVAVVGAMTGALVHAAAEQGVQLYITGQYRQTARSAVVETGLSVAIIGHATGEAWGLRSLAELLRERWAGLEVVIASNV